MGLLFPGEVPPLRAGEWRLREIRPYDAQSWLRYFSDPLAVAMTSSDVIDGLERVSEGIRSLADWFAAKTGIRWAIADQTTDEMVGSIGYFDVVNKDRRAELGYDLVRDWWGRGIASAAVGAVVEYGLEVMQLRRIQATVLDGNEASMRVLEKAGFEREGRLRSYKDVRGEPRDFWMFGLVRQ